MVRGRLHGSRDQMPWHGRCTNADTPNGKDGVYARDTAGMPESAQVLSVNGAYSGMSLALLGVMPVEDRPGRANFCVFSPAAGVNTFLQGEAWCPAKL